MGILYKKGDVFTTPDKFIVHGCNSMGVMGSGVAKIVKEKYPKAFQDYYDFCLSMDTPDLLGLINPSEQPDGKVIINAITQGTFGKNGKFVSYDAVDSCMKAINGYFMVSGLTNQCLSMPKIGAGLGGGQWSVIERIILCNLAGHLVTVWEFE